MKDYYRRLSLVPTLSCEEIASKLANFPDSSDRRAASHILAFENRRRVYDRVRQTSIQVGALRCNLGIGIVESDFRFAPTGRQFEKFTKRKRKKRTTGILIKIALAVGVVAGIYYWSQPKRQNTFEIPRATLIATPSIAPSAIPKITPSGTPSPSPSMTPSPSPSMTKRPRKHQKETS